MNPPKDPQPPSSRITVKLPKAIARLACAAAEKCGLSRNTYLKNLLFDDLARASRGQKP